MKSQVKITDNRLDLVRHFPASRQRVFEAWKRVDLIQQWWGCENTRKVESTVEFRVGGQFSHKMQIEGCGEYEVAGTFTEIIEPEKICYTTMLGATTTMLGATESKVSVEFIDLGARTELRLTQIGFEPMPNMDPRAIVSTGFTAALERLEQLLMSDSSNSPNGRK